MVLELYAFEYLQKHKRKQNRWTHASTKYGNPIFIIMPERSATTTTNTRGAFFFFYLPPFFLFTNNNTPISLPCLIIMAIITICSFQKIIQPTSQHDFFFFLSFSSSYYTKVTMNLPLLPIFYVNTTRALQTKRITKFSLSVLVPLFFHVRLLLSLGVLICLKKKLINLAPLCVLSHFLLFRSFIIIIIVSRWRRERTAKKKYQKYS